MKKTDLRALLLSIAICLVFATLGGLLTGNSLERWFAELEHPWFSLPLTGWYLVGGLYYLMAMAILYQLLTATGGAERKTLIGLTLAMLAGNEFWNYLFFGLESTLAGFVGLVIFALLVVVLFIRLWRFRQRTALILLPYVCWLAYDLVWAFQLWVLNN